MNDFHELKNKVLFGEVFHTISAALLEKHEYPWEVVPNISAFIREIGQNLEPNEYDCAGDGIYISKSAKVDRSAFIGSPCIIGHRAELRRCAFIRGSSIVGEDSVIGNSTEVKNCILFDGVQLPHFNYAGDSLLGYRAHLGAGAVISNVKSDKTEVTVSSSDGKIRTGLRKFGAAVGDFVEVGCNAVLNPGTVIGARTSVYPLSSVRGSIPPDSICKNTGIIGRK